MNCMPNILSIQRELKYKFLKKKTKLVNKNDYILYCPTSIILCKNYYFFLDFIKIHLLQLYLILIKCVCNLK